MRKLLLLLAMLSAGCAETEPGTLRYRCKPDGTCVGSLVCTPREQQLFYRFYPAGTETYYVCVLPEEVTNGRR